jgi:hypothetical protein
MLVGLGFILTRPTGDRDSARGVAHLASASLSTSGDAVSLAQYGSLRLGESRARIDRVLGTPKSPLKVDSAFLSEQPRELSCVYYRREHPDRGDRWDAGDTFRLCFRGTRLRHKWAYITARA